MYMLKNKTYLFSCDQMNFLFQYSPPCDLYTSSISVAVLGSHWTKSHHMNFSTCHIQ